MSQAQRPEDEVAELFRAAGQELTESVGARPGEIWRFARPTTGLMRPRTLWQVWTERPADWSAALAALEQVRVEAGADRALAVLWEGTLPEGYTTDLEQRTSTVITLRRLALELAGVPRQVRDVVRAYEREEGPRYFLQRRGTVDGEPVEDVAGYVVRWSQRDEERVLVLEGDEEGIEMVIREAAYRVGQMFLDDPEHMRPMLRRGDAACELPALPVLNEWVSWSVRAVDVDVGRRPPPGKLFGSTVQVVSRSGRPAGPPSLLFCRLEPVAYDDVRAWYRSRLHVGWADPLMEAYQKNADLAALLSEATLLPVWVAALSGASTRSGGSISERTARVVVLFFDYLAELRRPQGAPLHSQQMRLGALGEVVAFRAQLLEDAALEDHALMKRDHLNGLTPHESGPWLDLIGIKRTREPGFENTLVRDYFLARKIIREARAGHRDIFTRYQFPREHVLLFIAILSPETAAMASEGQSVALREEIAQQAEEEVQLVLAHHLKRSVGAIRTQVEVLREQLPRDLARDARRALGRIDQELEYLRRLADRTRRLHQVPQAELEDLPLSEILEAVVASLRSDMPHVACSLRVDAGLQVRGNRDSLAEIFSCLLENAFHAVGFDRPDPRVSVTAIDEGATVRVDVVDNGTGVRSEDRARIFDPRVTTKKGGDRRPLGTGMGLPIARKYAEAIGGRVDLDPDRDQTTFFVRLVRARGAGA